MGDTTPAAHRKIRELRLCEHTPAPPLEVLETNEPSLLPGDAVTVPPADDGAPRGVYAAAEVLEQAVAAGTYGIAASAMPGARILGAPPPRPSAGPVYRLDPMLTAVKDRAEWSDRDRVLAVIDSLTERLTVLERAVTELDQANLVMGDPIPAPPEMRKEGKTGTAAGRPRGREPGGGIGLRCALARLRERGGPRHGGADRQAAGDARAARERKGTGAVAGAARRTRRRPARTRATARAAANGVAVAIVSPGVCLAGATDAVHTTSPGAHQVGHVVSSVVL